MRTPEEPRNATAIELKWCKKMRSLMRQKPNTLTLFCNGNMHVLCTNAVNTQVKKGGSMPQPITGIDCLGKADGGDF
jgi:hypothetical protein